MVQRRYTSKLSCNLAGETGKPFFSLVDYRNNYFTSADPDKILEFYDGFSNREQLIQWMTERPKGVNTTYEVQGNKEIIVVIPTADYNGKYARECRENIFKGMHLVFVESGGKEDFYFNYAHNVNVGTKKALEYKPKWIVISNDDMVEIDPPKILINNLGKLNPDNIDAVYTEESNYHSTNHILVRVSTRYYSLSKLLYTFFDHSKSNILLMMEKFRCRIITLRYGGLKNIIISLFLSKKLINYVLISSFSIFSGRFISILSGQIFDETYINGVEDWDLSLCLVKDRRSAIIPYQVGEQVGATLGTELDRYLRDVSNVAYFNWKVNAGKIPIQNIDRHE